MSCLRHVGMLFHFPDYPVPGGRRARGARAARMSVVLLVLAMLSAPSGAAASSRAILVLGDSLSAEYGLPRGSGWVALLSERIGVRFPQYRVVNASISGETTSGGLARLDALLRQHAPALVVIELGANDGLRGLRLSAMQSNLQAMIDACRARGARVLLVGIRVPPNYGAAYSDGFQAVYETLARRDHVGLVPFLLDGFAEDLQWFQADHIHPLPRAQARMLENVWPHLQALLAAQTARAP